MATVPRDAVDSSADAPPPNWYDALRDMPVWQALEAEAGEQLTYTADRIQLGRGVSKRLGLEVYRVSRILLGTAGYSIVGDPDPPFSLLIVRD